MPASGHGRTRHRSDQRFITAISVPAADPHAAVRAHTDSSQLALNPHVARPHRLRTTMQDHRQTISTGPQRVPCSSPPGHSSRHPRRSPQGRGRNGGSVAAGEVMGDGVGGMAVQRVSGAVVATGGLRIRVAGVAARLESLPIWRLPSTIERARSGNLTEATSPEPVTSKRWVRACGSGGHHGCTSTT